MSASFIVSSRRTPHCCPFPGPPSPSSRVPVCQVKPWVSFPQNTDTSAVGRAPLTLAPSDHPAGRAEERLVPFAPFVTETQAKWTEGRGRKGKPLTCKCLAAPGLLSQAELEQSGEADGVSGQSDTPGGPRPCPAGAKNFL